MRDQSGAAAVAASSRHLWLRGPTPRGVSVHGYASPAPPAPPAPASVSAEGGGAAKAADAERTRSKDEGVLEYPDEYPDDKKTFAEWGGEWVR